MSNITSLNQLAEQFKQDLFSEDDILFLYGEDTLKRIKEHLQFTHYSGSYA